MRRSAGWIVMIVSVVILFLRIFQPLARSVLQDQFAMVSANDFVDLEAYLPVEVDLRYATNENVTGIVLYSSPKAYLRRGTADKLKKVCDRVSQDGYHLKIWDAYRPISAQFKLWEVFPDPRYIADPHNGASNHSRGSAVDITLVDADNQEVAMPSGFDEFGPRANRDYQDVSAEARKHAQYLETIMKTCGFRPLSSEWWHFDDLKVYPVVPTMSNDMISSDAQIILQISAIGDNTLGTDFRFPYQESFVQAYDKYGPGHFFAKVEKNFHEDDLTIANLETTLTDTESRADKKHQPAPFFFRGNPGYASILREAGIDAVNLANNHTYDYLEQGYRDTISALSRSGVESFGNGRYNVLTRQGIKIALLGYNLLGPLEEGTDLSVLKESVSRDIKALRGECGLIIVSCHWGKENAFEPTLAQRDFAHWSIDQGADLVLGHHPHVLQSIERYKGKNIVYSLGNFAFGGNFKPIYRKTQIYKQEFVFNNGQLSEALLPEPLLCFVSTDPVWNNYQPIPIH